MSSYVQSTPTFSAAPTAAPQVNPAGSGSTRRPSARTGFAKDVSPELAIPAYSGETSDYPLIDGFVCTECGARRPGGGVNRQSQATVDSACGPIRRGGKCRTCRRIAVRASAAFMHTTGQYMAEHGRGLDIAARQLVLRDALQAGRLAVWAVHVAAAKRQARVAERGAA